MPEISTAAYLDRFAKSHRVTLVGPMGTDSNGVITEPVIFVDGGAQRQQRGVGISVGDGDSFSGALDHQLNPEKDFSDLAFALSLLNQRFSEISLKGFLGGRRDHELLNLGEVFHHLKQRKTPTKVIFDQAITGFTSGNWQFDLKGIFSLVAFESTLVTLSGQCKYHIDPETVIKPVSSFGLSNEGYGQISIATTKPLYIYHND